MQQDMKRGGSVVFALVNSTNALPCTSKIRDPGPIRSYSRGVRLFQGPETSISAGQLLFHAPPAATLAGAGPLPRATVTDAVLPGSVEIREGSAAYGADKEDLVVVLNFGHMLEKFPVRQLAVWAAVAFAVLELRDFTGIFMGTFVLSVVGNSVVSLLEKRLQARRQLLVAAMYIVVVSALVVIGIVYLPRFVQDVMEVVQNIQRQEDLYSLISSKLRTIVGEKATDQLERFVLMAVSKPDTVVLDMSAAGSAAQRSRALQQILKNYAGQLVSLSSAIVAAMSRFLAQSVVSLIFSFMIVWDHPALSRGVRSLKKSRLSAFYEELAPVAATFGRIFGKALQAQTMIALTNTALTLLGILMLQISGVAMLSLIVFICSFVPVAGVILSTVPISLVAVSEGGLFKVVLVMAMVVAIHLVEAYILNPAIYSAHLKLHPVLALAALTVAEHLLGVWGLLVAVPLAVFVIEHVINRGPMTIEEPPVLVAA